MCSMQDRWLADIRIRVGSVCVLDGVLSGMAIAVAVVDIIITQVMAMILHGIRGWRRRRTVGDWGLRSWIHGHETGWANAYGLIGINNGEHNTRWKTLLAGKGPRPRMRTSVENNIVRWIKGWRYSVRWGWMRTGICRRRWWWSDCVRRGL